MKRMSAWIVTPAGLSVAVAVLVLTGGITGGSWSWWQGTGVVNVVVPAAGVVALLGAAVVLAGFLRAAWQRTLRPGWWPVILPAYGTGLLLGLIVAPFTALEIEAGVFMALLVGPVVLVALLWIALWTSYMVFRVNRRRPPRHRAVDGESRPIVVTAL